MQLMSWLMTRFGSRFSLLFEPYRRHVVHSALGRFLDRPLDLMVGFVEPDGTQRVLPFTQHGTVLYCPQQFDRINSITYRGFSEYYRLRFELNIHSLFYPQDEQLCTLPAFYLEMRINPAKRIGRIQPKGPTPDLVKLFLRINRPDTRISASDEEEPARIDLAYSNGLRPQTELSEPTELPLGPDHNVQVYERIVSLNSGCTADLDGHGLSLELPVTKIGSGIKWRLIWAAHCAEPVLQVFNRDQSPRQGRFRYVARLGDLDAVIDEAIRLRDDRLVHSRRFEKLFDQAPLRMAQRHLIHQTFQSFLSNSWWCDLEPAAQPTSDASNPAESTAESADRTESRSSPSSEWFSVWDGNWFYHSTIDVQYNVTLVYLALWPRLLAIQLELWTGHVRNHRASGGSYLCHDVGIGTTVGDQAYSHAMPVEENCDYLLMLQAYTHWTGDLSIADKHGDLLCDLTRYLIWADRDRSGFASEGAANTLDDASPALQHARKQTYLAIKRLAAIAAASDLLARINRSEFAQQCQALVDADTTKIESQSWLGDHYAVCTDRTTAGIVDADTGEPLPYEEMTGWDAYSIYTANGLMLPAMIGQPWLMDRKRLRMDLANATRETIGPYGCGHTSYERDNTWISQNLWRDHLACYLGLQRPHLVQRYWDLQAMSNTGDQSKGFIDTDVTNNLCFYPRGVTSMGFLLAQPRLVIDRLAPGGQRVSIEPDRNVPQRWPLLPLADWKAGRIPVCVVDDQSRVTIESEIDPVIIRGSTSKGDDLIG